MSASESIAVHGVEVFPHERMLVVAGHALDVTTREFDIMLQLATHPGWVYSAEQLADSDQDSSEYSPESVSVHVSHLRRKLAAAGAPDLLETVRGVGYRLHVDAQPPKGEPVVCALGTTCANPYGSESDAHGMRDATWDLIDAVRDVERAGTPTEISRATEALRDAQRAIRRALEE